MEAAPCSRLAPSHSRGFGLFSPPLPAPSVSFQPTPRCMHHKKEIGRFNKMNTERERKLAAGEAVPELVGEQIASGDIKVPWTTA